VAVRRALLSVYDPEGLVPLAQGLNRHSIELWATEGTRRHLKEAHVEVHAAEELTGIGSWFGGRVKTLHPGILGGILAPRTPEGLRELAERHLVPIELVGVNLYPFAQRYAEAPTAPDLVEMIDIGGVTLLRAAAKNHAAVTVLSSPLDYAPLIAELDALDGAISAATRRSLAAQAFARVTAYDRLIARALGPAPATAFPDSLTFVPDPVGLRYGENPHQAAQPYLLAGPEGTPLAPYSYERLKGDPLSFNNLLDLDAALAAVSEFDEPGAAVIKHASPCGVACGATIAEALERAVATDPVARYGCVIALNRPVAAADVASLNGVFVDLLATPDADAAARSLLGARRKLKLLRVAPPRLDAPRWEVRGAVGRLLLQEVDRRQLASKDLRLVAGTPVSPEELRGLDFAWRVVRHAKSNAIVLAQGSRTVGIGSGQPTRVKAAELACGVAGERARGALLASDAFFPFPDGVEVAGRAGVRAILQPGGSLRDPEVTAVAARYGISMYYTGWRVFRH